MPILVAPTAYHCLAHPEGECITAQATRNAGTVMIASTFATRTLEEIRGVGSEAWMQLYFYRDSDLTASLVRRAEQAGYRAIVLTVDSPYWGGENEIFVTILSFHLLCVSRTLQIRMSPLEGILLHLVLLPGKLFAGCVQ